MLFEEGALPLEPINFSDGCNVRSSTRRPRIINTTNTSRRSARAATQVGDATRHLFSVVRGGRPLSLGPG
jgi:hypothetical protein